MSGQAVATKLAPGTPCAKPPGIARAKRWRKTAGGAGRGKWMVLPGFAATHHVRISRARRIQMRTLAQREHRAANNHPAPKRFDLVTGSIDFPESFFLFQYIFFFLTTTFLKTKDGRDSQSSLNISANTAATQSPRHRENHRKGVRRLSGQADAPKLPSGQREARCRRCETLDGSRRSARADYAAIQHSS